MAEQKPATPPPTPGPWYARLATTAGRPAVLGATLIMSMPGEYHVAKLAGWSDPWAYGMPFSLSAYAGIAAVVAATRPKGARGRWSATLGAGFAIVLALASALIGLALVDLRTVPFTGTVAALVTIAALAVAVYR